MTDMDAGYEVPLALTIVAGVFLALGAFGILVVTGDIIWRKGWKSMMLIMIPTYVINAGYMPLAIYVYFKYSRPDSPGSASADAHEKHESENMSSGHVMHEHSTGETDTGMNHAHHQVLDHTGHHPDAEAQMKNGSNMQMHHDEKMNGMQAAHMMHAPKPGQPMWATVAMGVAHCGGGCVLGDLVGEWIIWGTGATIRGRDLWPCLLVDFGFALLFGIAFQYFSIAPMTGEWGPKTMWRAAKADFLSLVFFEVGLFGWMIIFEVGIWNYMLEMNSWTYWWMMQVGMVFGFVTAMPINWWLLVKGIKAATH